MDDRSTLPLRLIEFPADDAERALAFWQGLLGVSLSPREAKEGSGWQSPGGARPAIGVHRRGRGPGDTWSLPYFEVDDMASALESVTALGGAVTHPGEAWAAGKAPGGTPSG